MKSSDRNMKNTNAVETNTSGTCCQRRNHFHITQTQKHKNFVIRITSQSLFQSFISISKYSLISMYTDLDTFSSFPYVSAPVTSNCWYFKKDIGSENLL